MTLSVIFQLVYAKITKHHFSSLEQTDIKTVEQLRPSLPHEVSLDDDAWIDIWENLLKYRVHMTQKTTRIFTWNEKPKQHLSLCSCNSCSFSEQYLSWYPNIEEFDKCSNISIPMWQASCFLRNDHASKAHRNWSSFDSYILLYK